MTVKVTTDKDEKNETPHKSAFLDKLNQHVSFASAVRDRSVQFGFLPLEALLCPAMLTHWLTLHTVLSFAMSTLSTETFSKFN